MQAKLLIFKMQLTNNRIAAMVFKITRARKAPEKKIPKAEMSVWDRGLEDLLANIEVSITEATGRYHTEGGAYAKPKASKCWRVKSSSAKKSLKEEVCIVGLKAGGVKLAVLEKGKGIASEVEVDSPDLRDQLVDLKQGLEKIKRNTGAGKDLFEALKAAYKPKKDSSDYKFDAKSERWMKK
jgi:hypothetical protein